MSVPRVNTCCGILSLQTGTVIFSCLIILYQFVLFVWRGFYFVYTLFIMSKVEQKNTEYIPEMAILRKVLVLDGIAISVNFIGFIVTIVMIVTASLKKPKAILFCLILMSVALPFAISLNISVFLYRDALRQNGSNYAMVGVLFIWMATSCYLLVVVYSFYKSLVDPSDANQDSYAPSGSPNFYPTQQYVPPPPAQQGYANPGQQYPQQQYAPPSPGYPFPTQQGNAYPGQQYPQQQYGPPPPGYLSPNQQGSPWTWTRNPGQQSPPQNN